MGNVPTPLSGFIRTGSNSFEYRPGTHTQPTLPNSPDLIVICSWLDAEPRHIAKYTNGFKDLYPTSRILLTTNKTSEHIFRSAAATRKAISPVVSALISEPPESKILAATYSGGGCISLSTIGLEFRERTGRPVPLTAILLDSGPPVGNWEHLANVPYVLPPNPIAKFLGMSAIYAFLMFEFSRLWMIGKDTPHNIARATLNDKTVFDPEMKRVYVVSESDPLVKLDDVKGHMEEANSLGWKSDMERFVGSGHVGHLRVDPERYWGVISRLCDRQ